MARTRKKQPLPTPPAEPVKMSPPWARTALRVVLALGVAAGLVLGLAWVGREAGLGLVGRDRYAVKVADIECDAPPGTDRAAFLTEVRYLGPLPETVQSVDPGLTDRLAAAFARHPWVAAVTAVEARPAGGLRVGLRFRTPVLAVTAAETHAPRAVDAAGVLLPPAASTDGLTELVNPVPPPPRPAGEPWPDRT